ncbi:pPIWI-associating nuclease domain-containing protein [Nocardioides sp. WG-D5]
MTPAQFRSAVQKAQREQKQAINNYNREVRKYNAGVKKAVDTYNREARAYNAKVRRHNAKVENQRRRLNQEIQRLNSRPTSTTYVTYQTSVTTLARSYEQTEERLAGRALTPAEREVIDRVSEDAANSAYLLNALEGDGESEDDPTEDELRASSLQAELAAFSQDLKERWAGALFALSPRNPDAARHFCTSAREVLVEMLDVAAPDKAVLAANPNCPKVEQGVHAGKPSRRAKVEYLLARRSITDPAITGLVEADMENVVNLFGTLNRGTHGHAGRFTITQLSAIRERIEAAVVFVYSLYVPAT